MCFIPTVAKQAHVAQRDARPEGQSREGVKPIEQHGFTLVDFHARQNGAALLQVGCETQPVEAIDALEPFHTTELARPT